MKNLTLKHMAQACGGKIIIQGDTGRHMDDQEAAGVVLDSRQVQKDYVFIAVKGERADGHSFISQVFGKGAAAVVCEEIPAGTDGYFIQVEDSLKALKDIACYYRQQLDIPVVGITGSTGKTSTREFVASVLSVRYRVLQTEGNFNNEIGLPLTILKIRDEHEAAVVEMGISDFGEMHRLSRIARPDMCVLTNIGQCHLENLKSREGILRAKTEIFDFMKEDGWVCINGDDDMLVSIDQVHGRKPLTFGRGERNRIYADGIENRGLFGSRVNIHMDSETFEAVIPLPGEHMVYNALAAAGVGSLFGLGSDEIALGINRVQPVGGRSHLIHTKKHVVIDDCYNANPVSMCAALDLLATAQTRKVAVLGDMYELGDNEKQMHARVGAYAAEKGIDAVVCIGSLAGDMYQAACAAAEEAGRGRENIHYFADKEDFLVNSKDILKDGDTVLVKASHAMAFDEIVRALEEWKEQ